MTKTYQEFASENLAGFGWTIDPEQIPEYATCVQALDEISDWFLIVAGECTLFVEGEERHMKQWDYFHCPADTNHVMVATGDEPCVAIAVGSRASRDVVYPEFEPARRHGGAVEKETTDPKEAYAGMDVRDAPYRDGWLPDL